MDAEAQRQLEQLRVDVVAVADCWDRGDQVAPVLTYADRAPGLFADRPTTARERVLAMLLERVRRETLVLDSVSDDQATFCVRLRCGLVVVITPVDSTRNRQSGAAH